MKVHFIAIGGSAMHNLAIALHDMGFEVTGSDDEFFEPSKTRLKEKGLLPEKEGWDVNKITQDLDAIILGMHAREGNPELDLALALGIKVYSYPEYIYEQSKNKKRVVIAGSHGKTTITAMVMHVLKFCEVEYDYMVGAQLDGFDTMVKLTSDAPLIILEGDEYLASAIDKRPKFHLYRADIALLSGISWDHINVFPTFETYLTQFRLYISELSSNSPVVYNELDAEVKNICEHEKHPIKLYPYKMPSHRIINGVTYLNTPDGPIRLRIFGDHNLLNLEGARLICNLCGVKDRDFYNSIGFFNGAAKRLQLISQNEHTAVYKDFAHSPSKLSATTTAVKKQYRNRKLIACMELHTFSSLNKNFLKEYRNSMADADEAIIYFNPHTIEHKKLPPISSEEIMESFGGNNLKVFTDSKLLNEHLTSMDWKDKNLLLMSSGSFDGMNMDELAAEIIG